MLHSAGFTGPTINVGYLPALAQAARAGQGGRISSD